MRNESFIRVMHRIFSWFFYGSISLLVLWLIFMPTVLTQHETNTANRSKQVTFDTLLTRNGTSGFSAPIPDNTGQLISKVGWQDGYITYYGENDEPVSRLRVDSLKRSASALRLLRKKHARQIDSVLLTNPTARIYQLPDRWLMGPEIFSGMSFSIKLPFNGFFYAKETGKPLAPTGVWQRYISYKPDTRVQLNQDQYRPYELTIGIRRWSDLTPSVWPMMVLTLLMTLLSVGLFLLIVYWFRAIFADLLRGHYFERQIVQRVRYIGWLSIGTFIFKNIAEVVKSLLAQHYLQSQGYEYAGGWIWGGPDYWLWLWGGLILLVFAQIFSYGTQLQREHDLTI